MQVRMVATGMFAGLLVAGCSASSTVHEAAAPTTPAVVAPAATPTPTPTPVVHKGLKRGAKGEDARGLQRRLAELNYDPGKVDGKYGQTTQFAVWAFEKVNKLKHGGTVSKK